MEADEKVKYEDENEKEKEEKFTNFEFLKVKVEVLEEQIKTIGEILKQNNLTKTTKEWDMTPDFDDEAYKKLEEED